MYRFRTMTLFMVSMGRCQRYGGKHLHCIPVPELWRERLQFVHRYDILDAAELPRIKQTITEGDEWTTMLLIISISHDFSS